MSEKNVTNGKVEKVAFLNDKFKFYGKLKNSRLSIFERKKTK
jgi:hypothetical protein